jgi:hypothetical protein
VYSESGKYSTSLKDFVIILKHVDPLQRTKNIEECQQNNIVQMNDILRINMDMYSICVIKCMNIHGSKMRIACLSVNTQAKIPEDSCSDE